MRKIIATVTERAQLTLPVGVRRFLGIQPHQKVAFQIEADQVRLVPVHFTLDSAYGSIAPLHRPEDFTEMIAQAMEEHAAEVTSQLHER